MATRQHLFRPARGVFTVLRAFAPTTVLRAVAKPKRKETAHSWLPLFYRGLVVMALLVLTGCKDEGPPHVVVTDIDVVTDGTTESASTTIGGVGMQPFDKFQILRGMGLGERALKGTHPGVKTGLVFTYYLDSLLSGMGPSVLDLGVGMINESKEPVGVVCSEIRVMSAAPGGTNGSLRIRLKGATVLRNAGQKQEVSETDLKKDGEIVVKGGEVADVELHLRRFDDRFGGPEPLTLEYPIKVVDRGKITKYVLRFHFKVKGRVYLPMP